MFPVYRYEKKIIEICRKLKVKRLDLVGSASRKDFNPKHSDIDLLVEFEGSDHLFDRYFQLKADLEQGLGRHVDLIQNKAVKNPYVRKALEKDRMPIYGT